MGFVGGSRTRGSGKKAKRGKSLRGGVGNSGRFDHKKIFKKKDVQTKKIKKNVFNLYEVEQLFLKNLIPQDIEILDLKKLGIKKILAGGKKKLKKNFKILGSKSKNV